MDRQAMARERRYGFALGITFTCFVLVTFLVPKLPEEGTPVTAPRAPLPALPPWLADILREVKKESSVDKFRVLWDSVPQETKLAAGYVL